MAMQNNQEMPERILDILADAAYLRLGAPVSEARPRLVVEQEQLHKEWTTEHVVSVLVDRSEVSVV